MNQTLEKELSKVRNLPESEQTRLAGYIHEFVEQAQDNTLKEDIAKPSLSCLC